MIGPSLINRIFGALARPRRQRTVALLLMVGTAVALCFRVIFGGETFCLGDLAGYYRPAKALIAPLARASGGVPAWNPLFASGQPFAGNPEHEVFHPLTSLFFVLPFEVAFALQVILPLLMGSLSMFVLSRTLGRSGWASLLGALCWGFGGYLLSTASLLPILFAAAVLPMVLALVVRLLREVDLRAVAGLALCVGWQCLAGEPTSLMMTVLPMAAFIIIQRRNVSRVRLLWIAAGFALGVAIGGAALIPGFEHASKTIRANGLPAEWTSIFSMPPLRAFDLLSPHVLGHPYSGEGYWGLSWYAPRLGPLLPSLYPGLLATALAVVAVALRFRRFLPLIVLAGFGYLLALGKFFFLWPLLRRLPMLSMVRFPEKFALLFSLPVVIGAIYGFDYIVRGPQRRRRVLAMVLAGLGGAAALLALALWLARGQLDHATVAAGDALRLSVMAALLATLLFLQKRVGASVIAPVLVVVLALDLVTAGKGAMRTCERSELKAPPFFLRPVINSGRDETVFHGAAWIPGIAAPLGTQGLAMPPIPAQWGLALTLESDFDLTQLRWTWESTDRFWGVVNQDRRMLLPLLRRRGVTTVVQAGENGQGPSTTAYVRDKPLQITTAAIAGSQPFIFAARRVELVDGGEGWEKTVSRLGAATSETACVERAILPIFPEAPAPAEIQLKMRAPDRMAFDVLAHGPAPSFLAINQTWDRFWRASVDGVETNLIRTDVSLSGLVVPPGSHRVVLEYDNPWLAAGMGTSTLALIACLILVLIGRRRAVRQP